MSFSDGENEDEWCWVNGEEISYINWHIGELSGENSSEDYAMFYYRFDNGTWNDGYFNGSTVNGEKTLFARGIRQRGGEET